MMFQAIYLLCSSSMNKLRVLKLKSFMRLTLTIIPLVCSISAVLYLVLFF